MSLIRDRLLYNKLNRTITRYLRRSTSDTSISDGSNSMLWPLNVKMIFSLLLAARWAAAPGLSADAW